VAWIDLDRNAPFNYFTIQAIKAELIDFLAPKKTIKITNVSPEKTSRIQSTRGLETRLNHLGLVPDRPYQAAQNRLQGIDPNQVHAKLLAR
jgi:Fe2+ transport system protein FeoA